MLDYGFQIYNLFKSKCDLNCSLATQTHVRYDFQINGLTK